MNNTTKTLSYGLFIILLVSGCGSRQNLIGSGVVGRGSVSPAGRFFSRMAISGIVAKPQDSVWLLQFSREWNRGEAWVAEYSPHAMHVVQLRYEPDLDSLRLIGAWVFEMGELRWKAIRAAFRDAPLIWGDWGGKSSSTVGFAGHGGEYRDTEIDTSILGVEKVCERLILTSHRPVDKYDIFNTPPIEGMFPWILSKYYAPPAMAEPKQDGIEKVE